ncbi:MAG: cysteine hydrolase [Allomuricauda sp.]|nr:MAG: cysteine hydrolase [Allomuricauda sp.]
MGVVKLSESMIENDTALLLIDIQKGLDEWDFYGGNRNNHEAETNAAKILDLWRSSNGLVVHVRHSSQNPNSPLHASKPGFAIKELVAPKANELVFTKNVNSAFIGTELERTLREAQVSKLIVVGLTTNHCVSTSVRMASNLGFEVNLIEDACATFDFIGSQGQKFDAELMHQTALASLKDEFANLMTTANFLENKW